MDSIGYQFLFASPTSNEITTSLFEGLKFGAFVTLNEYVSTPVNNNRNVFRCLIKNCAKVTYIDFFCKRTNWVINHYLEDAITTNLQSITNIYEDDPLKQSYQMYLYVLNTSLPYYISLLSVYSSLHFISFCWKCITYSVKTWFSTRNEKLFYQENALRYLSTEYNRFINRVASTFISCMGMYGLEAIGMAISSLIFPDLDLKSVDMIHDLGLRYFFLRFCYIP